MKEIHVVTYLYSNTKSTEDLFAFHLWFSILTLGQLFGATISHIPRAFQWLEHARTPSLPCNPVTSLVNTVPFSLHFEFSFRQHVQAQGKLIFQNFQFFRVLTLTYYHISICFFHGCQIILLRLDVQELRSFQTQIWQSPIMLYIVTDWVCKSVILRSIMVMT